MHTPRAVPIVYPGQRVIAACGATHIVAFTAPDGRVFAYGRDGMPREIRPVSDAWGGESTLPLAPSVAVSTGPRRAGPHRRSPTLRPRLAA